MKVNAVISDADFLPAAPYRFGQSILILWAKLQCGTVVIIENFGTKKMLTEKFAFSCESNLRCDLSPILHRKCELEMADARIRFLQYI